jgi:hypothetical protein
MAETAIDPISGIIDTDCLDLVREYCWLAIQPTLSERDSTRLGELLTLAEEDGRLEFWINEADHFIDHALGLGSATLVHASVNEDLKSRLREMLDLTETAASGLEEDARDLLAELRDSMAEGTRTMQQTLAEHGFDPGPIDGIAGPKTHQALKDFQRQRGADDNSV